LISDPRTTKRPEERTETKEKEEQDEDWRIFED
jgi:hypothetical protein